VTKLSKFMKRYEKEVEKLLAEMPELDREEMLRPFWKSSFLPENSRQLLMLAEAVPEKTGKIINVLVRAALGRFLSEYLAAAGSYAEKELKVFRKQTILKGPILSGFLSGELDTAAKLLDSIHISDLEDLAVFVSCLDYVSVFMSTDDAIAKLKKELIENGLAKKDGEKCDT